MNKNAIKKFAIEARQKLIASVTDKAGMLGITAEGVSAPTTKGNDFEVYQTAAGTEVTLNKKQCEQRRRLVEQIETKGFEEVVEEVAYTWFNRICAIRFMEVNDYLPSRVRALSSEKEGKNEPDLVTQAPDVELDLTDAEKEFVIESKMSGKLDELFAMLFVKQCNKLHEVLPELFEETSDYTEMLLSISFTNKDDVIRMLIDEVTEEDFNITTTDENGNVPGQVEIIGWLYQYYNTELKDDTFAKLKKNIKITKERIPAATQLFTPDWIVRYMVENSVGRLWIEHLRAVDPSVDEKKTAEEFGWKYYLPEAEQEESVNQQLATIRADYKNMTPEDITCIDPCMGSGHILVAMFDVLMDIYKSAGYSERDAALLIVQKNIHGLDIDKRAYQLAYFAVMMKGRQYNRKFLRGGEEQPKPRLHAILDSNSINRVHLKFFGSELSDMEKNNASIQIIGLLDELLNASEYGSILEIKRYDWQLLEKYVSSYDVEGQITFDTVGIEYTKTILKKLINQGEVMSLSYYAVVTNPPYMGNSGMNKKINDYVKNHYPDSRSDLSTVMMEKSLSMCKKDGFMSMINIPSWMFISSYENMRHSMLLNNTLINMLHFARGVFGSDFGTTGFVFLKKNISGYNAYYKQLFKTQGTVDSVEEKQKMFFNNKKVFYKSQKEFLEIPGNTFAYWISDRELEIYSNTELLEKTSPPRTGMMTTNNNLFLRFWYEVNISNIGFNISTIEESIDSNKKWFPYNKGGDFRRWYGNRDYVVNWENEGRDIYNAGMTSFRGRDFYFMEGITWSIFGFNSFSARYTPVGSIFDIGGTSTFPPQKLQWYILSLLNSKVGFEFISIVNPTVNIQNGDIKRIPLRVDEDKLPIIDKLCRENIELSKEDWDSFETSWDFKCHPLVQNIEPKKTKDNKILLSQVYEEYELRCRERFNKLKSNEEAINKEFISIYGLENDLSSEVEDKYVTVCLPELSRDIRSLLSYAVGCIMGRYSLDKQGIVSAGEDWNLDLYESFKPDNDGVIPISDEEYFDDDIVGSVCEWLKVVYGYDTLEKNLEFIANALGNKGDSSRETLRNYFLKEFVSDHMRVYQKRPIYWMFDAGKEDGFKALIYLHRYTADTVGIVRTEYLHKTQKAIEQAMQRAQYMSENASSAADKKKAVQQINKYTKQLAQMKSYDEAMAHIANQRIEIDLDDGVKVNYEKFQGVEVAQEGKKALKIDLLAKIK